MKRREAGERVEASRVRSPPRIMRLVSCSTSTVVSAEKPLTGSPKIMSVSVKQITEVSQGNRRPSPSRASAVFFILIPYTTLRMQA